MLCWPIVKYRERGRLVGCADNVLQTARELLDDVTHGVRLWAGFQAGARPRSRAPIARAPVALHTGRQETLAHRLYHLRRHEAARLLDLSDGWWPEHGVGEFVPEPHGVPSPLQRLLHVATPHTLAHRRTRYLCLITFTVVFETATSFTVTPFVMPPYNLWTTSFRFTYLRPKSIRVPIETGPDGLLSEFLVLQVVVTVVTVAAVAELAVSETVAVQLETLRLGAVTRLTRPEPQVTGY